MSHRTAAPMKISLGPYCTGMTCRSRVLQPPSKWCCVRTFPVPSMSFYVARGGGVVRVRICFSPLGR